MPPRGNSGPAKRAVRGGSRSREFGQTSIAIAIEMDWFAIHGSTETMVVINRERGHKWAILKGKWLL